MDAKWIGNVKLTILKYRKKIFVALDKISWDFPGGTVDKNLPASARDTGSILDLGNDVALERDFLQEQVITFLFPHHFMPGLLLSSSAETISSNRNKKSKL